MIIMNDYAPASNWFLSLHCKSHPAGVILSERSESKGSDLTAACGRVKEGSEWQWSANDDGALPPRSMPGTTTGLFPVVNYWYAEDSSTSLSSTAPLRMTRCSVGVRIYNVSDKQKFV